jgi:hypothetical protein
LADGVGGVADGGVDLPPLVVVVQLGEAAALGVEDLGELADVELAGVGAGGGTDPEPVAAADGPEWRQVAGDRLGDAAAGGAAAAGWAPHLPESFGVAQVMAGVADHPHRTTGLARGKRGLVSGPACPGCGAPLSVPRTGRDGAGQPLRFTRFVNMVAVSTAN